MKYYSESRLTRNLTFDLYARIFIVFLPFFALMFIGVNFYNDEGFLGMFENGELILGAFFITSTSFIMSRKDSEIFKHRPVTILSMLSHVALILMFMQLFLYTFVRMHIFVDVGINENNIYLMSIVMLFTSIIISVFSRYVAYKFDVITLRNDTWYTVNDDSDLRSTSAAQERMLENLPAQVAKYVIREIKVNPNGENKSQNSKLFQTQIRELFHSLMTPVTTVNDAIKLINISKNDEDFDKALSEGLESINRNLSLISALLYAYRGLALLDFCTENSGISINVFVKEAIKSLNNQHDKKTSVFITGLSDSIEGFSTEFVIALFCLCYKMLLKHLPMTELFQLQKPTFQMNLR